MTASKHVKLVITAVALIAFSATLACNKQPKSPDVEGAVRQALDQSGLKDVRVSQDRDKGVVTLTGEVPTADDRSKAESVARSVAGDQVVANEIGVRPPGDASNAKAVESDIDKGIDKNLDAMLIQHKLNHAVRYDVKNGTVTLKGTVASEAQRSTVEKLASQVPNVSQVVNELEVRGQKATSTARNR